MNPRLLVLAAVAAGTIAPSEAEAQLDPIPQEDVRRGPSIALIGGFGAQINAFAEDGSNAYRWGFGFRGGVTLRGHPIYLGGVIVHYLGTTADTSSAGTTFESKEYRTMVGPELGYDVMLTDLVMLRPYVSAGLFRVNSTSIREGREIDDNHLTYYVAPGLQGIMHFGRIFYGAEIRWIFPPAEPLDESAIGAQLTLGVSF